MAENGLASEYVLTTKVNTGRQAEVAGEIVAWAGRREGRSICFAPVHTLMESFYHDDFRRIVNGSDLVLPDGAPVAWALRKMGRHGQQRIDGSSTMLELCRQAGQRYWPIGLYGGHPEWLDPLKQRLIQLVPQLQVSYAFSPPFRPLTAEEDDAECQRILDSGARLLFVGLGCPKQERWMAQHRSRLTMPMLGVGAAFDFHSGHKKRAPIWLQRMGCEWFFRLICEPRRLGRRYLYYNAAFLWHTFFLNRHRLLTFAARGPH